MPTLLTPARLTAIAGVATGLGAAATSLTGVFTVGSSIGNAVVAASGVLGTVATVAKFLDGNSKWETAVLGAHVAAGAPREALPTVAGGPVCKAGDGFVMGDPTNTPVDFQPDPELDAALNAQALDTPTSPLGTAPTGPNDTVVLPGEEPVVESAEPERLVQQLAVDQAAAAPAPEAGS